MSKKTSYEYPTDLSALGQLKARFVGSVGTGAGDGLDAAGSTFMREGLTGPDNPACPASTLWAAGGWTPSSIPNIIIIMLLILLIILYNYL